ncbi:unnamed protein product, partial [Discosporangium mesarthrocarpum]
LEFGSGVDLLLFKRSFNSVRAYCSQVMMLRTLLADAHWQGMARGARLLGRATPKAKANPRNSRARAPARAAAATPSHEGIAGQRGGKPDGREEREETGKGNGRLDDGKKGECAPAGAGGAGE